jgi:hypothetical protein
MVQQFHLCLSKELEAGTQTDTLRGPVNSSTIQKCQKVEITQMTTDKWTDKQNVA